MKDQQLQQFFAEHRQEISDSGFSDRTIRRLPEKQRTPGLVWIFAILSTLAVVLSGNYTRIFQVAMAILEHAYWWLLPVTSCTVAFIILFIAASYEKKHAIFR